MSSTHLLSAKDRVREVIARAELERVYDAMTEEFLRRARLARSPTS